MDHETVVAVFRRWASDSLTHPEEFGCGPFRSEDVDGYAEACADYFFELLHQMP